MRAPRGVLAPAHITYKFEYNEKLGRYATRKIVKCPCCLGPWGHGATKAERERMK